MNQSPPVLPESIHIHRLHQQYEHFSLIGWRWDREQNDNLRENSCWSNSIKQDHRGLGQDVASCVHCHVGLEIPYTVPLMTVGMLPPFCDRLPGCVQVIKAVVGVFLVIIYLPLHKNSGNLLSNTPTLPF